MQLIGNLVAATTMLATAINATPLHHKSKTFDFRLVHPIEYSIDVASQLFIEFCQNANFGAPCDGGYVAPGLCYYTPFSGVSAVWPGQDISGCTLYRSSDCDATGGDLTDVAYPGIPDLTTKGLNDQVKSFICY